MTSLRSRAGSTLLTIVCALLLEALVQPAFASPAFRVRDINPGTDPSTPYLLVDVAGRLYFQATDGETGFELWVSDGTEEETRLVGDLNPGPADSLPYALTDANGTLFLLADDGVVGLELWKVEAGGLVLVKDTRPGLGGMQDAALYAVGDRLYFLNRDWEGNRPNTFQLWTSLGTSGSTGPLFDTIVSHHDRIGFKDTFYFGTYVEGLLMRSDGTSAGTRPVREWAPAVTPRSVGDFAPLGEWLLFYGLTVEAGLELWRTDGTVGGTVLVKDINPDYSDLNGGASSGPAGLKNIGGVVYFSATDGASGVELWRTNGLELSTYRVKDLNEQPAQTATPPVIGTQGSFPSQFTEVRGSVVFTANDGLTGTELWISDGSESGTGLLKDIHTFKGSEPAYLTELPGKGAAIFSADDGVNGREPWITDGTPEGTRMLQDIAPDSASSDPSYFTVSGDHVFFVAHDRDQDLELWAVPLDCVRNGYPESCGAMSLQLPSDLNQDASVDISDGIALLLYLFAGGSALPCGDGTLAEASNVALLDANGDGGADLSDAIRVLSFLFLGAPPPVLGTECLEMPRCPSACNS